MDNFECKICGSCCLFYPITPLTPEEVESGKYDIGTVHNNISYLETKKVWIPRLKKVMVTCVYFDPITKLCFMHGENKPTACKQEHCWGTQCELEWKLSEKGSYNLCRDTF